MDLDGPAACVRLRQAERRAWYPSRRGRALLRLLHPKLLLGSTLRNSL